MALHPTQSRTAALRGSTALLGPVLTVLPGGWRDEEAQIEVIALCDEVIVAMGQIVNAEIMAYVPSMMVIRTAERIAAKATRARREYLDLTAPDGSAA